MTSRLIIGQLRCLAGIGNEGDRTKGEARIEKREIAGKTERLRGIRGQRNESTKQFELETKCDLRAEVRYGATRKQNTINNLGSGTPGNQKSE